MKHLYSILILLVIGTLSVLVLAADSSPPIAENPNKALPIETLDSQEGVIFHDVVLEDEVLTDLIENKGQVTPVFAIAPEVASIDYSMDRNKEVVKLSSIVIYDKTFNPTLGWEVLYRNTEESPATYDLVLQNKIPRASAYKS